MKKQIKLAGALLAIMMSATSIVNAQWSNTTAPNTYLTPTYTGNVGISNTVPSYKLQVDNNSSLRSASFQNDYNNSSTKYGIYNRVTGTGTGGRYGVYNSVSSAQASTADAFGVANLLVNPGSGPSWGIHNTVNGGSNQTTGILNQVTAGTNSTVANFGLWNILSATGTGATWGIYSDASNTGGGDVSGIYATGYGSTASLSNKIYGVKGYANGNGVGNAYYGVYGVASGSGAVCTSIGVYGSANGTGSNWAGYFNGKAYVESMCIGTTLTSLPYKLNVCGTIRATEVRVEAGWCDYVFAHDYKLPSLNEVESYIKINKHLPGVTAGPEIEKNGLEVGKVSSQMIKKIEELTLYVIELQKQVDTLKNNQNKN
jgi:hypothetical protein